MESVNYNEYDLSNKIIEFCEKNGITKEILNNIYHSDIVKNEKVSRINPLIHQYGIIDTCSKEVTDVCIKDVVGFEPYNDKNNLYEILNECYSDGTATYGLRDNDKLNLSLDEMLKDIETSIKHESIKFDDIEGKIFVSHNGCHRVSMLKFLYLIEVLKREKQLEDINKKYTIKGTVSKYDMTLTYMNYFFQMIKPDSYIKVDYDDIGTPTNKYVVVSDNKTTVSRDEIINLFNETLNNNPDKVNLDNINMYVNIPSFREFLKKYILKENNYGNSRNNM